MFETARLEVRELADHDCESLIGVHESNPGYVELIGGYDLGRLQRDLAIARITPGRHLTGAYEKSSGEPVGVLDWMAENPSDGRPWLGLIMIRADRQCDGLGVELFEGLCAHLRGQGAPVVRAGVTDRNPAGRALARRLGLRRVSVKTVRMASEEQVIVFEREL